MLAPVLDRLREVPQAARSVLLIAIQRGDDILDEIRVPFPELRQVTNLSKPALTEYVETLARYGLARFDEDFDGNLFVVARDVDGWPFWRALATYCKATDIPLEKFVIDLRFDLLD